MTSAHPASHADAARNRVHVAASHLYDAECALHVAHQTDVDAWVIAAYDKLQDSVAEHTAAVEEYRALVRMRQRARAQSGLPLQPFRTAASSDRPAA
jgi:hypothetical protein